MQHWIKLDDGFLDHPKFLEAGPLASYLHIAAIAWSKRNRTDGQVPRGQVARLVDWTGIAIADDTNSTGDMRVSAAPVDARALAGVLVEVGLWEELGRGWLIHDYADWQTTSEQIDELSAKRRDAGKRGAAARWGDGKDGKAIASE